MTSPPFKPGRRARHIVYDDDTEFPGLDMRVYGLSVEEYFNATNAEALEYFADRLIEWNWVDDNNQPVPTTREGIDSIDASDMLTLISDWMARSAKVRRPLAAAAATNGQHSQLEAGLPMEAPEDGT